MEWITISQAAHKLNVSTRTIERRVKSGRINASRDTGRTLVEVDVLRPSLESTAHHLSEVVTANTIQADTGQRQLSDVVSICRDAQKTSRMILWVCLSVASASMVGLSYLGVSYHQQALKHVIQEANLEHSLRDSSDQVSQLKRQLSDVSDRVARAEIQANHLQCQLDDQLVGQ